MDIQLNSSVPPSLIKIPEKKLNYVIDNIKSKCGECKDKQTFCEPCQGLVLALERYWGANIPVDYWLRDMGLHFRGNPKVKTIYDQVVSDLSKAYGEGIKFCLAGPHGVGKTMACSCILKRAVEKGFSALHLTLSEIVSILSSGYNEEKAQVNRAIMMVDFLFIDEFDPRYVGSANAADLFGRILEPMLRHRVQNTLPLLLCTNSPNVLNTFSGSLKTSLSSLMNRVKIVSVMGEDFRGKDK